MKIKTVILATDISGLGKVAATAALPLFAICQLEVALLPTMFCRPIQADFQTSI